MDTLKEKYEELLTATDNEIINLVPDIKRILNEKWNRSTLVDNNTVRRTLDFLEIDGFEDLNIAAAKCLNSTDMFAGISHFVREEKAIQKLLRCFIHKSSNELQKQCLCALSTLALLDVKCRDEAVKHVLEYIDDIFEKRQTHMSGILELLASLCDSSYPHLSQSSWQLILAKVWPLVNGNQDEKVIRMVLNAADVLGTDFLKDIYSMHFKTLISLMAGNKEIPAVQAAKIFTKIIEKIEVETSHLEQIRTIAQKQASSKQNRKNTKDFFVKFIESMNQH